MFVLDRTADSFCASCVMCLFVCPNGLKRPIQLTVSILLRQMPCLHSGKGDTGRIYCEIPLVGCRCLVLFVAGAAAHVISHQMKWQLAHLGHARRNYHYCPQQQCRQPPCKRHERLQALQSQRSKQLNSGLKALHSINDRIVDTRQGMNEYNHAGLGSIRNGLDGQQGRTNSAPSAADSMPQCDNPLQPKCRVLNKRQPRQT